MPLHNITAEQRQAFRLTHSSSDAEKQEDRTHPHTIIAEITGQKKAPPERGCKKAENQNYITGSQAAIPSWSEMSPLPL